MRKNRFAQKFERLCNAYSYLVHVLLLLHDRTRVLVWLHDTTRGSLKTLTQRLLFSASLQYKVKMQIQHYYQLSVTIHEQHTKTKNTPLLTCSSGSKWISELYRCQSRGQYPSQTLWWVSNEMYRSLIYLDPEEEVLGALFLLCKVKWLCQLRALWFTQLTYFICKYVPCTGGGRHPFNGLVDRSGSSSGNIVLISSWCLFKKLSASRLFHWTAISDKSQTDKHDVMTLLNASGTSTVLKICFFVVWC